MSGETTPVGTPRGSFYHDQHPGYMPLGTTEEGSEKGNQSTFQWQSKVLRDRLNPMLGVIPDPRQRRIDENMRGISHWIAKREAVLEGAALSRFFDGETDLDPDTNVMKPEGCKWIDTSSVRNYFANVAKFSDNCGILASQGVHRLANNSATRLLGFIPSLVALPVSAAVRIAATIVGGALQIASHLAVGIFLVLCVTAAFFTVLGVGAVGLITHRFLAWMDRDGFRHDQQTVENKKDLAGFAQDLTIANLIREGHGPEVVKGRIKIYLKARDAAVENHRIANYWYGRTTWFDDKDKGEFDAYMSVGLLPTDAERDFMVEKLFDANATVDEIGDRYNKEKRHFADAINSISRLPLAKRAQAREAALTVMIREDLLPTQIKDFADKIIEAMRERAPGEGAGYEMLTLDDQDDERI